MMQYTSLLGHQCQTKSHKVIPYSLGISELFLDPISHEMMKEPIILDHHPVAVYDKKNLITWFYHSNIEPLTGVPLDKFIKITPFVNYYLFALVSFYLVS